MISRWTLISWKSRAAICLACSFPVRPCLRRHDRRVRSMYSLLCIACTGIKQSIIAAACNLPMDPDLSQSRAAICLACSSPPSQAVPQATRSPCQEHVQSIYNAACTGIKQSIIARLAISLWTLISRKSRAAICLACSSPPSQAVPQAIPDRRVRSMCSLYIVRLALGSSSLLYAASLGSKCWRLEVSRAGPGSPGWPGLVLIAGSHRRDSDRACSGRIRSVRQRSNEQRSL